MPSPDKSAQGLAGAEQFASSKSVASELFFTWLNIPFIKSLLYYQWLRAQLRPINLREGSGSGEMMVVSYMQSVLQ